MKETKTYWDPLLGNLGPDHMDNIKNDNIQLEQDFERLREDPASIKRNIGILIALGFLFLFIGLILFGIYSDGSGNSLIYLVAFLGFLPLIIYTLQLSKIQQQMNELLVANKFNWLFDPKEDFQRWIDLSKLYPEIFNLGSGKSSISNQFWGSIDNGQRDLWIGLYTYTTQDGDSSTTYHNLVYSFRLSKPTPADFAIIPKADKTVMSYFEKKIETESNEFNKAFYIQYKGDAGLVGADIYQILNPEIQAKLLEYQKQYTNFRLLFRGEAVFVEFHGDFPVSNTDFQLSNTNFIPQVNLDARDAEAIQKQMIPILALCENILISLR